MKKESHSIKEEQGKIKTYLIGFVMSIVLTLLAYFLTTEKLMTGWALTLTISTLAFIQVIVQLLFFLHMGEESSPRWNLISFLFMVLVILILVIGTLWIMYNLDYRMVG